MQIKLSRDHDSRPCLPLFVMAFHNAKSYRTLSDVTDHCWRKLPNILFSRQVKGSFHKLLFWINCSIFMRFSVICAVFRTWSAILKWWSNRPHLWGLDPASPENLIVSDPLGCISKHSETFLPTLYMLDWYISMIYAYISISYFDINAEFSIICVPWIRI